MKERIKQRKNRKRKEESLNFKNTMGTIDPTPYYAVQRIIRTSVHGNFYAKKGRCK